jgi:hypothetical protein
MLLNVRWPLLSNSSYGGKCVLTGPEYFIVASAQLKYNTRWKAPRTVAKKKLQRQHRNSERDQAGHSFESLTLGLDLDSMSK